MVDIPGQLVILDSFIYDLKTPSCLACLVQVRDFYPIATAPPDLAPAHNSRRPASPRGMLGKLHFLDINDTILLGDDAGEDPRYE
jgi:hypothetical protein